MNLSFIIWCLWSVAAVSADRAETSADSLQGTRSDVDIYGNIYLLNADNNTLTLISKEGEVLARIGSSGWQNNQFDRPDGLWARNGIDVFVADYGNHRVQRFDRKLNFVSSLYTRENDDPDQRFGYPTDIAFSALGDLFVCDGENSRVLKVNRFTQVERIFGGFDAGEGRLQKPTHVEIGPHDRVYVVDKERVVEFDYFGNFLNELGSGILKHPTTIFADKSCVVVSDGDHLYRFDENDRLVNAIPMESLLGAQATLRSLSLANGSLYLLADTGMKIVPDPWTKAPR
jgi:DNA-binding beta-propeller fold protein YncE